ncbi:MAG: translation elongation factor Ts [Deltaproteobacteria bacterium]|nr:translation elongation factor Ts [Deltaproteobacteria bacterium]
MEITAELVKLLREKTGAPMMDCKKALTESGGDEAKAIDWLRQKGLATAAKRSGRAASMGAVSSYIHMGGKIGVLVEVNCETDFVAKTGDFQGFVKELGMQVAAASPQYVRREEVPAEITEKEKEIYRKQMEGSGKPPQVIDKIVDGKLNKWYSEVCLMEQPWVRDDKKSIDGLLKELIGKLGENIVVRRFARFQLGEASK